MNFNARQCDRTQTIDCGTANSGVVASVTAKQMADEGSKAADTVTPGRARKSAPPIRVPG